MTSPFTTRPAIRTLHVLTAALVLALTPARALAQAGDADAGGTAQVGPVGLKPSIGVRTEYDSNVFRTVTEPMADVISIVGANTDAQARVRRIGLTVNGAADWVHYSRFDRERGANASGGLKVDFLFNRFTPYVSTSYTNSRQRLNHEIDIRARNQQSTVAIGGIVHLGGKTDIELSATRSRTDYAGETMIDGVNLGAALNRSSDQVTLSMHREVTTRTRLTLSGEVDRDQFGVSSYRDADNMRLTAGFESTGAIKGHARAGMQMLKPSEPGVPAARGPFLSVGTTATVRDRLQIGVDAERDMVPSYRPTIAYYESYNYGGSISYALRRSLRLSAQIARRYADYQSGIGLLPSAADAAGIDVETSYGSGIRFLFGQSMSIDFAGTYTERTSPLLSRRFEGMNVRAGISHAF